MSLMIVSISSCFWQEELAHCCTIQYCSSHTWSHYSLLFFSLSLSSSPFSVVCVCVPLCGFVCAATRINLVLQLMLIGMTFNTRTDWLLTRRRLDAGCVWAAETERKRTRWLLFNVNMMETVLSVCTQVALFYISYISLPLFSLSNTHTQWRLSRLTVLLYLAGCLLAQ